MPRLRGDYTGTFVTVSHKMLVFLGISIVLVVPFWHFWELITPIADGRWSIQRGDFTQVHFPMHFFVVNSYQHGRLPLWAPGVNAGQPAFADIQFDAFYPPTIFLAWLLGPSHPLSPGVLILDELGHYAWGGLGMFILAFSLIKAPEERATVPQVFGATFAGIAFELSGYLTSYPLQDVDILQVSVWLPWVILGLERSLLSPSPKAIAGTAVSFGMAITAGHPQALLYIGYTAVIWCLLSGWRYRNRWQVLLAAWLRCTIGMCLGILVGLIQLLPTLQMVPLTVRRQEPYSFLSGGFRPQELLGAFLVQGFGSTPPAYLGVIVLLSAVAGFLTCGGQMRLICSGLLLFGSLMSLGRHGPLYPIAYHIFPGFAMIRDQERAIFIVAFVVALLAALGLSGIAEMVKRRERNMLVTLFLGATICAALFWWRMQWQAPGRISLSEYDALWRNVVFLGLTAVLLAILSLRLRFVPVFSGLLVLLAILDLQGAHSHYGLVVGKEHPYPLWGIIRTMQDDKARPFRVSTEGTLPGDGNEGLIYGLEDVIGSTPLELARFAAMNAAEPAGWLGGTRRSMLLNVRYIVTKRTFPPNAPLTFLGAEGDVHLYRLSPALTLPRAWLVHTAIVAHGNDVWKILGKSEVGQIAVVDRPLVLGRLQGTESVEVQELSATHLVAHVVARSEGLLVWSQIAYPGWHMSIDGEPVAWHTVDGALMGTVMDPGVHTVVLRFEPHILIFGAIGSGIGLLAAGILVAGSWYFERRLIYGGH
ncbi:MAG: YfhO family protein [Chloroflexi bacterium]|nr:YfhO family protein [Chloroflexota bacterium]